MARKKKKRKTKKPIKRNYEHYEHQIHVTGTGYHGSRKYNRKKKHKGREDY